jgi:hypothetical protein
VDVIAKGHGRDYICEAFTRESRRKFVKGSEMRPLPLLLSFLLLSISAIFVPSGLYGHVLHVGPDKDLFPVESEPHPFQAESLLRHIEGPIWTRLHILETIRHRSDFEGSIEISYPAARGSEVRLLSLSLIHEGRTILERSLDTTLNGDGGWYAALHRDLERLPPETSYIYANRKYVPLQYHEMLSREETRRLQEDIEHRISEAREDAYFLAYPPMELIRFDIPVTELIAAETFRPGEDISLSVRVRFDRGTGIEEIVLEHVIRIVEPLPAGPTGPVLRGAEELIELRGTWHYGDLHVHDCKDESSIIGERGCPTCYAETLNWGDDNSLAALKNQYVALGSDWFTITSHSYCVESEAEYNNVRFDANSLSGPSFLVIPDTELQSEERGPQEGGDEGDLVCWNGVNHMGAHWITSWKPGGSDGLLEFCNNPIFGFLANIEAIRAEGGFGIINHPTGTSWVWNSYEFTHGFTHPQGFQGVEIWNGPIRTGQGGDVGWWVRNLLDRRPMYAYSGSDTHDDVFDFGWNHAYVVGPLTSESLREALRLGRVYISNYQALVILLHDLDSNRWAYMGSGLPVAPSGDIELGIYYDFGSMTGEIQLYKGVIGDSGETLFHVQNDLTGSGWLYVDDPDPAANGVVYYRAYSSVTSGGIFTAYTNPVYVRIIP